jgi:uncharacterized protein
MDSALKNNDQTSQAVIHVFRLHPHQDLKKSIIEFTKANSIRAACIVTCVGSLEQVNLRFANQQTGSLLNGFHEILSLAVTFSDTAAHLHLSVADNTGKTIGGHLLDDNLVYTTAEIVIMELSDLEFVREVDPTYGYPELKIKKITPAQ